MSYEDTQMHNPGQPIVGTAGGQDIPLRHVTKKGSAPTHITKSVKTRNGDYAPVPTDEDGGNISDADGDGEDRPVSRAPQDTAPRRRRRLACAMIAGPVIL